MPAPIPTRPEAILDLPRYRIDRTEVSNAHWLVWSAMHEVTGVPLPDYPDDVSTPNVAAPRHPATGMDAYAADAFCRWMGRRLPTSEEWTKAGRGGLQLANGQNNPKPRRNLAWGGDDASAQAQHDRANLQDSDTDWRLHSAPVDALPLGASPYNVLGIGGNVSEWTSTTLQRSGGNSLRVLRDAQWDYPTSVNMGSLAVVNERAPRYFLFSIGLRCCASDVGGE